jgi:hypothetical protein
VSFLPGYGIRAFLNGYAVSGQINGATASHRRSYGDTTVATTTGGMSWVPGLKSGSLTLKGPFDGAAALQAQITAAIGVDNSVVVTVLPDGDAVGKPRAVLRRGRLGVRRGRQRGRYRRLLLRRARG